MSNFANSESIILKGVRALWLDVFKPGEGMDGGAPKYKVSALVAPGSENEKLVKQMMVQAAKKLWPENAVAVIQSMTANSKCLRDGNGKLNDDGSVRPEYKDMLFISSSNKSKPQVVGPKKHNGKFVTILESGRGMVDGVDVTEQLGYELKAPYKGCFINLKIQCVAGKQFKGVDGKIIPNQVFARVEAVQFASDGEAFGAGPTSAEGFGEEDVAEASESGDGLF